MTEPSHSQVPLEHFNEDYWKYVQNEANDREACGGVWMLMMEI